MTDGFDELPLATDAGRMLLPVLEPLIDELKEEFRKGTYSAIAVLAREDELLGKLVAGILSDWNLAHGRKEVPAVFGPSFAGAPPGRILVVTSEAGNGAAVATATRALLDVADGFDVASFDGGRVNRDQIVRAADADVEALFSDLALALSWQPVSPEQEERIWRTLHSRSAPPGALGELERKMDSGTLTDDDIGKFRVDVLLHGGRDAGKEESRFTKKLRFSMNANELGIAGISDLRSLLDGMSLREGTLSSLGFRLRSQSPVDSGVFSPREILEKGLVPRRENIGTGLDGLGWPVDTRNFGLWSMGMGKVRAALRTARRDGEMSEASLRADLSMLSAWLSCRISLSGDVVTDCILPTRRLLRSMRDAVANDDYGFILGDDTSGRIPALLVAKSVNAYRKSRGLRGLPVIFLEGTKHPDSPEQKAAFLTRKKLFPGQGKRGLIVTERVGTGANVQSLIGLITGLGFQADVASFGNTSAESLRRRCVKGEWGESTRVYVGGGESGPLLDREDLTGLVSGAKYQPHPAIRGDRYVTESVRETRKDIAESVRFLERGLEAGV